MTPTAAICRLEAMLKSLREMPACGPGNLSYVVHDLAEDVKELRGWQRFAHAIGKDAEWLPKTWRGVMDVAANWAEGSMETTWSNARGIIRKLEGAEKACGRR